MGTLKISFVSPNSVSSIFVQGYLDGLALVPEKCTSENGSVSSSLLLQL